MKILFFGIYDPSYSRNRVLRRALESQGAIVKECKAKAGRFSWIVLTIKYFVKAGYYDVMLVAFPGQTIMPLARLLTRKPIIFDAFTSHFGGYILDRRKYSANSWHARYYKFIDGWSCGLADLVLLDTSAHIDFFVEELKLSREKFRRVFVGSDSSVFYIKPNPHHDNFLIHFHGHYIPLQGVLYILGAAKLLEHKSDITFQLIGSGQTYIQMRDLVERNGIKNVCFLPNISYHKLPEYMARADLCLGIFGDTPKTELVIPNKVFEAVAMGKPVITADTKAARELFDDGKNILFCKQADSESLASVIMKLYYNRQLLEHIARGGYELFKERLTENKIGEKLIKMLYETKTLRK